MRFGKKGDLARGQVTNRATMCSFKKHCGYNHTFLVWNYIGYYINVWLGKKIRLKFSPMIFDQSGHRAQQPPISRCLRYLVRTKRCDCCLQCLNSVIKWVSNWEVKFYNIFTRKNICYCFFEKYGKQCTQINKVCWEKQLHYWCMKYQLQSGISP